MSSSPDATLPPAAALHLRITGRVQGVGYRASFAHQAQALGLTGWVRNRRDGSVEALIEGDASALARMLEWSRRGPPAAQVLAVNSEPCKSTQATSLQILPDA